MFTFILCGVFLALLAYFFYYDLARPKNFPPGPRGLPWVGNTPLLRQLAQRLGGQHLALSQLAVEYKSPVVGLKLGRDLVVVALTPPIVRQVLTKDEFIGRPNSFFVRLRCFGERRGVTFVDGELWHEQRAFTLRTLRDLGMGKPRMELLIQDQVQQLVQQFHQADGGAVCPMEILSPCILRVLWQVVAGQVLPVDHPQLLRLIEILTLRNKAFDMAGGVLSQIPWIRHIAPQWSGYSLLTSLNSEMKSFLMETVDNHKATYDKGTTRDLIDAFLHELHDAKEDPSKPTTFSEEQMIMVLVDLFLGGASSTTTTLDWALLLMLHNPQVQEQVYQELCEVTPSQHQLPTTNDKPRLPYTEAVMLEVQRLCTVIPVIGPRRALADTTLNGYNIPKGTTVLMSEWSVHRDPTLYPQPDQFRPERFLDTDLTTLLDNFIPFGGGKRRCLGESLAKPCLFLIFTSILKTFKIERVKDASAPSLVPTPGIILTPRPYKALFTPRSNQKLSSRHV